MAEIRRGHLADDDDDVERTMDGRKSSPVSLISAADIFRGFYPYHGRSRGRCHERRRRRRRRRES